MATTEQTKKFITVEKLKALQYSINFLDNYKNDNTEQRFVLNIANDYNSIDEARTMLLKRLGELNAERESIINKLLNN